LRFLSILLPVFDGLLLQLIVVLIPAEAAVVLEPVVFQIPTFPVQFFLFPFIPAAPFLVAVFPLHEATPPTPAFPFQVQSVPTTTSRSPQVVSLLNVKNRLRLCLLPPTVDLLML